jgi:hypothetical protein
VERAREAEDECVIRSPAMRTALSLALAIAIVLPACGGKKDPPAAGSGSAPAGSGSAPAAAKAVELFVDDVSVAKVDLAAIKDWPRLDTLVPVEARRLGKWQAIITKGAKPAPSELNKPFETYRDYVPALFPGDNGTVSFGMFDPVELGRKGKPALREDGITELRVKLAANSGRGENETGAGGGTDPTKLELKIKTAKGEQILKGDKLMEIPREAMPGGGGDAKGWQLVTVLEAAGIKKFEKLLLTDAAGLTLTLEKKEFDGKDTIPFIKLNRQGALRFRILKKQGDGYQATGDLRALASIEVLK